MSVVLEKDPLAPVTPVTIPVLFSAPVFGELVAKTEAAMRAETEARQRQEREHLASRRREVYGLD